MKKPRPVNTTYMSLDVSVTSPTFFRVVTPAYLHVREAKRLHKWLAKALEYHESKEGEK